MPPDSRRFLKPADVAEQLNVSVRQVLSLLSTGELRGIQVGGRGMWRIEDVALDAYIEQQYQRSAERNPHRESAEID